MTKKAKPEEGSLLGRETLLDLTEEQWFDLLDRLKMFTNRRYFGIDGRDSIQEAILAVMDGRRGWDSTKTPFHNLCLIIRSVTSNQLAKDKRFIPLDDEAAALSSPTMSRSFAEAYERRESDEKVRARLGAALRDDELSRRVVDQLISYGAEWKPEEMAEALGEEKKEINNVRRRLARKLRVLLRVPKRAS